MAKENKIRTAGQEARVRELAAQGATYRQIAEELTKNGFAVSHMAVSRFLREETAERKEAARSVAANEAKESIPLITKALTRLVVMNMTAAVKAYRGEGGSDENPKPNARELATASAAAISACRELRVATIGDEPTTGAVDALRQEVEGILAARSRIAEE